MYQFSFFIAFGFVSFCFPQPSKISVLLLTDRMQAVSPQATRNLAVTDRQTNRQTVSTLEPKCDSKQPPGADSAYRVSPVFSSDALCFAVCDVCTDSWV